MFVIHKILEHPAKLSMLFDKVLYEQCKILY